MYLNRYSSRRVHNLLQKLRNLITLEQWTRRKLLSRHYRHGRKDNSNIKHICWNREDKDLKKHLWLGRLVEWWSLMGLLPKHKESKGEKQIAHMWKEMSQSRQKSGITKMEEEKCSLVIQGLVTYLGKQNGSLWAPDSSGQQCYPPPSLKTLLKLVLIPHVDTQAVHAVIMYFILDVAKFLQCRNDLFKSFCHAFTIPTSFSHQIRAFWLLDHGQIKTALDLLLSPKTTLPRFSWQHRCILQSLLSRKERLWALRYLHLSSPAMESVEDVKLRIHVFLQNSCVSEAWALTKRYYSEDMITHFHQTCNALGLSSEASKYIPSGSEVQNESDAGASIQFTVIPPCPLSATLYRSQRHGVLSTEELLRLLIQAVAELRQPSTCVLRQLTWPQCIQKETKTESSEVFLSTEMSFLRSPSPSIVEITVRSDDLNLENPDHPSWCLSPVPPVNSRRRVSFSSVSSLSPIRKDQTFSFESTVTLQQISALLIHNQEDEEEVSQVSITSVTSITAEESLDRTLEGSAVTVIDHSYIPRSFRNRFYSTDCCIDLPSLPEEMVQTPTTPTKPVEPEDSEIFQETGSTITNSIPQDKEVYEPQTSEVLSPEISFNPVNVDDQTNLSDRSMERESQVVIENDTQSIPSVVTYHLPSQSSLPYVTFPEDKDTTNGKQADKGSAAGRHSAGKVATKSRRARKNKRLK